MNKITNAKEIMIILISVILIAITANVFASDAVLGDGLNTISGNEYQNAQTVPKDNNIVNNNSNINFNNSTTNNTTNNNSNNSNNTTNNVKKYNTNNTNDLPQTGIEDYNIGILLIICVASAIYAYKKVKDYRNI